MLTIGHTRSESPRAATGGLTEESTNHSIPSISTHRRMIRRNRSARHPSKGAGNKKKANAARRAQIRRQHRCFEELSIELYEKLQAWGPSEVGSLWDDYVAAGGKEDLSDIDGPIKRILGKSRWDHDLLAVLYFWRWLQVHRGLEILEAELEATGGPSGLS